jgi:hypothetical protein
MRNLFLVFCLLILAVFPTLAQEKQPKPLTQMEFVQLLYQLPKNPAKKDELVETIRRRGIDFVLTGGLKGLVATKSGNDATLRRTLEEAERRRLNPTTSQLPSEKEANEVLAKSRELTLQAVDEMPDFVVRQVIARSYAYAGTENWQTADRLTVAVSYREKEGEEYRLLSLNGVPQPEKPQKKSYEEVGGTSSTGEFVTVLNTIFKPESETKFSVLDTDTLRERRTIVFNYEITREKAKQLIVSSGLVSDSTVTGMKGRLWIDRENFRVLRVESIATEIPANFPIRAASRVIDYDWVTLSDQKFLLPLFSDVRLTSRQDRELIESRNEIRFRNYQKYSSSVQVLDDGEEVKEDKP